MLKFYAEMVRKAVHLSSLWIPVLYLYAEKTTILLILVPLAAMAFAVDLSRRFCPWLNNLVNNFLGYIMRQEEKKSFSFSGATTLLVASSLTIVIFNKEIAILALSILMISDSCAALIGKKFAKVHLVGRKSLEGSLSFMVSAIIVYYFFTICYSFTLPLNLSLLAILVATIAELFAKKIHIDDNFIIPLVLSLVLSLG
jgi:phytol kinase